MNEDIKSTELTVEDFNKLHENRINSSAILERMDMIRSESAHLYAAIDLLKDFQINDSVNGGIGDAERAKAINAMVTSRETTLQMELKMLEKMYDDMVNGYAAHLEAQTK